MAARIFATIAALLLVSAFAFAALAPANLSLGQALTQVDRGTLGWLRAHSAGWMWEWLEMPLLVRPLWLAPASLGVICAGLALSLNRHGPSASRRRS